MASRLGWASEESMKLYFPGPISSFLRPTETKKYGFEYSMKATWGYWAFVTTYFVLPKYGILECGATPMKLDNSSLISIFSKKKMLSVSISKPAAISSGRLSKRRMVSCILSLLPSIALSLSILLKPSSLPSGHWG